VQLTWLKHCLFSNDTLAVCTVPGRGLGVRAMRDIRSGETILTEKPIMSIVEQDERLMQDPEYSRLFLKLVMLGREGGADEEIEECSVEVSKRIAKIVFPTLTKSQQARWMALHDANAATEDAKTPTGIFQTNAISSAGAVFIFGLLSRINHSCMPNVYKDMAQSGDEIVIKALFEPRRGDELLISYTPGDMMKSTHERREVLQRRYKFACNCERCGPVNGGAYDGWTAANLRKCATDYFARGKLPQACRLYHRALHCWDAPTGRERAELLCHFAAVHLRIGDSDAGKQADSERKTSLSWYEKALDQAEEAIAVDDTLWLAHRRKGDALNRMQRQREGAAAYSTAQVLRPS